MEEGASRLCGKSSGAGVLTGLTISVILGLKVLIATGVLAARGVLIVTRVLVGTGLSDVAKVNVGTGLSMGGVDAGAVRVADFDMGRLETAG